MMVIENRGFTLEYWRNLPAADREIEILFFLMKNEYETEMAKKRQER